MRRGSSYLGKEWPRRDMTAYTRIINYDQKSASEDMMFAQPVFGGRPFQRRRLPHRQPVLMGVHGDRGWCTLLTSARWSIGLRDDLQHFVARPDRPLQRRNGESRRAEKHQAHSAPIPTRRCAVIS